MNSSSLHSSILYAAPRPRRQAVSHAALGTWEFPGGNLQIPARLGTRTSPVPRRHLAVPCELPAGSPAQVWDGCPGNLQVTVERRNVVRASKCKRSPHEAALRKTTIAQRDCAAVERTFAWLGNFLRLLIRWERRCSLYQGFVTVAVLVVSLRRMLPI
jgi:hypothetical protein